MTDPDAPKLEPWEIALRDFIEANPEAFPPETIEEPRCPMM